MSYEKNGDASDFKFSDEDKREIGRNLSRRLVREIRRNIEEQNFGPEGSEGAPRYSTEEAFIDITEPSGRESKFRRVTGASEDTQFVRLERGYEEFRSIYRGESGSQVELKLTGEVTGSMRGAYSLFDQGVVAGLRFADHSRLYRNTTPQERARHVNEQYQFIWLDNKRRNQILRKTLREAIASVLQLRN